MTSQHSTDLPPSALDVAEYILERSGAQGPKKLQKLVYYCQVWSIVWRGGPLFHEEIQAWVHGPVVSELYQMHAHQDRVLAVGGHSDRITQEQGDVIDEVLRYYSHLDGRTLSQLTHDEDPWKAARGDLPENHPSTNRISQESIRNYYTRRPCGGGHPVTCFDSVSLKNAEISRRQLQSGQYIEYPGRGLEHACNS